MYKPRSDRPELKKVCVYNGEQEDGFVGLRYSDGVLNVCFPFGYSKPADDEKEYRKDILNLITVLAEYSKKFDGVGPSSLLNDDDVAFPIHAYIHVFNFFLNHGYYVEKESSYGKAKSGKINWSKTIKTIRPYVIGRSPNESTVYLDFITRKFYNKESEIITQIHKYCVYESYEKIGCLFEYFQPEKPIVPFNAEMFVSILKSKISKTFNEKHVLLFRNMLDIVCYMGRKENNSKASYGTKNFEYVWENLINDVFGITDAEKEAYYPHCVWKIKDDVDSNLDWKDEKRTALRPDTIMLSALKDPHADIFVLDAKYYKYGEKVNPSEHRDAKKLPGTGSIIKQISYAEFIDNVRNTPGATDEQKGIPKGEIYNAFVLPYAGKKGKDDYALNCFGYAACDWKNLTEKYHKIYGILLDVRAIMYRHPKSSDPDIQELAKLIRIESERDTN